MKRRVLHIITGLEVGGAETNLSRLIPKLEETFENQIVCLTGKGIMGRKFEEKNIPVHYLEIKNIFGFFNPRFILKLIKIIKKFKPDIIETYLIHADLFGRIWGRIFGVHKIICNHRGSLLQWSWLLFFDRITSFLVTKYVFQTPSAQKEISKKLHIDIKKTIVIPNTINAKDFQISINKEAKIKELGIGSGNINIIIVSNLRKGKGHRYLIEAFDDVFLKGYKNINLLIAGDGEQRPILENQAAISEARNNIYFLGKRSDVPEILRISDIFVLPTFYEGMSNAIMEAMAAGLPIITTDIDVNKDLIKNSYSGILVPVKDSQEIITRLINLINDRSERMRLGENAYNDAIENYSISNVSQKVTNLMKSL